MKPENKLIRSKKILLYLLFLTPLLGFLSGILLPKLPSSNMLKDYFWAVKISNPERYDMVVVGDSRIYRGVNPQIISQKLNTSVFNFGFSSAGLDSILVQGALQLLKPDGKRILLIGITPASFTGESLKNEHFQSLIRINKKDLWIRKHIYPQLSFFDNYSFSDLKKMSQGEMYFQTFNPNGFAFSDKIPADTLNALQPYIEFLKFNKVNDEAKRNFFKMISHLKSQGITCIAFRVPIAAPVRELENSIFDFTLFKNDFILAGGHWLSIPESGFRSYDGSHLDGVSANKLSGILADSLYKLK